MQKNLAITSCPHIRSRKTTQKIMQDVCIALAPAGIAGIVYFGARAAAIIAISVVTCVLAELVYEKMMNQRVTIGDWSAVVTGLLLAYNLPSTVPLWIPIIGGIIAIVLVKMLFGGIGSNFMNPALTARAVLFVSWGGLMGTYPITRYMADTVSAATPLAVLATDSASVSLVDLMIGNCPGVLGETCKLAILAGGIFLIARDVLDWKIPACFIGSAFLLFLLTSGFNFDYAVKEIFAGSLMLGAIFMATDYATSPQSNLGRVIFGVGCGLILFIIRAYANYPEGCSFSILFMNILTPLIDRYTAPKYFGEVKQHG